MDSTRADISIAPEVLIDSEALEKMRFIDMVGRVEQMKASPRYTGYEIYLDGSLRAIVAKKVSA